MDSIDDYFQSTSVTNDSTVLLIRQTASGIGEGKTKLEGVIKSLEPYLVAKDTQKRSKSIKFISQLVAEIPNESLNSIEVDYLSTFLFSKLDDHYTVSTAALPGLDLLLKHPHISTQKSLEIVQKILKEIHVQSLVQSDRHLIFSMLKYILASESIVSLVKQQKYDTDFVFGLIQAIDGEKDPRNLVSCFECIRLACSQLNLGPFVDETFEVFACYFPIDFTPPKSDSLVITKQMLVDSLRSCFSANSQFAKLAIPLLIEKLNSSVESAQQDALDTYAECANRLVYDPNDYKEYLGSLWSAFQNVAMNAAKTALEESSLAAIRGMSYSLSCCVQTSHASVSLDSFIGKACESCVSYLSEPDLKLVWPNVKCLQAAASSTSTANLLVLNKIIPVLIEHFNTTTFQNQRKTYLDILWQFLANTLKFDTKSSPKVLKDNINSLLEICIQNESNKLLRLQSLTGLSYMLHFENLVGEATSLPKENPTDNNYQSLARVIWHSLWTYKANSGDNVTGEEERNKTVEIVYLLMKREENILAHLFSCLNESLIESADPATGNYQASFDLVDRLSQSYFEDAKKDEAKLRSSPVNSLLKLTLELFNNLIKSKHLTSPANDFVYQLFDSYRSVLKNLNRSGLALNSDENVLLFSITNNLVDIVISNNSNQSSVFNSYNLVSKFSLVIKEFGLRLKKDELSTELLRKLSDLYLANNEFKPFEITSPAYTKQKTVILMQLIDSLNKTEFQVEVENVFGQIHTSVVQLATQDTDDTVSQIACEFYSSVINKLVSTEKVSHYLSEEFRASLVNECESNQSLKCLHLWTWITKALVLREHAMFSIFTGKLLEWLENPALAKKASEGFNIILNDSNCMVMSTKTSSNIKLFYKQRFFNSVIEPLKVKFDEQNAYKIYYTMAVLNMVGLLPNEIVQKQLKSMLPILLYSLNHHNEQIDESIYMSSLKSFELLLHESLANENSYLLNYTGELVQRLLAMCVYENSMEIRLLSLKCLNNLASSMEPNKIIKYQKDVCKHLERCLNDKKRLCRRMAVEARNRWFLLTTKNAD